MLEARTKISLVASSSAARTPRLLDDDDDEDGPVHRRFGTHGLWGVFCTVGRSRFLAAAVGRGPKHAVVVAVGLQHTRQCTLFWIKIQFW